MDELRHPQYPSQGRRNQRPTARPSRLGQTLQEARHDKGLDLRDLAALTNVRVMHLEALEQGDFGNLPEDPYGKNFVRLYAQAVGLEPSRILLLYSQERRSAAGEGPKERTLELPPEARGSPFDDPRLSRILRLGVTLLLVAGLVLTGLWLFNRTIVPRTPTATLDEQPAEPANGSEPAQRNTSQATTRSSSALPATEMILLTLRTTPPGASIRIGGSSLGTSPVVDAPVQAGTYTVRVTQEGYQPYEERLELRRNRTLNFTLTPLAQATSTAPATNQVRLTVTEEAWLEIYQGSARGEGERLIYETAPPGATFTFDAPLYVFSGNAGGVQVTWNGETQRLGDGVSGQAYAQE